jgi:hypothetical protein
MKILTKAVALSAAILPLAALGTAGEIINSATGLASPATTITFEEIVLPQGAVMTNEYAGLGVIFSGGATYDPQHGFFPDASVGNFNGNGCCNNPIILDFTVAQTDAAFQFVTNTSPPNSTFSAFLAGSPVDSFSAPTNTTPNWFGFTGLLFDEIQITGGGNNGAFLLDNLELSNSATDAAAAPEPATFGLMGSALIGLAMLARKRCK